MKTPILAVIALVALGTLVAAMKTPDRRVVWNPDTLELSWTGEDGRTKHVIDYRTARMTANGKKAEAFSRKEADMWVDNFMVIERYLIESERWHKDPAGYENSQREKFEELRRRQSPANRASLNGMVPGR
jgi:hypothetical protein